MRQKAIEEAMAEARKFLNRAAGLLEKAVAERKDHGYERVLSGSPESGALRRQSMELTRALARMRRP